MPCYCYIIKNKIIGLWQHHIYHFFGGPGLGDTMATLRQRHIFMYHCFCGPVHSMIAMNSRAKSKGRMQLFQKGGRQPCKATWHRVLLANNGAFTKPALCSANVSVLEAPFLTRVNLWTLSTRRELKEIGIVLPQSWLEKKGLILTTDRVWFQSKFKIWLRVESYSSLEFVSLYFLIS